MTLRLRYTDGTEYTWELYRDPRPPAGWVLRDDTGYERTLERNLTLSAPKLATIAANHGMELLTPIRVPS